MAEHAAVGAEATRPTLLLRGLDSLYVSFYLDTQTRKIDWDDLAYRKEKAGRDRGKQFAEITLGTERFALRPFGRMPYKFVLSNRAFEVRLSERLSPSCHVQFFSERLWTQGLDALVHRFERWADSVDLARRQPEVVSRADWAFDYHLPVKDFARDHFLSRATKDASWREHGDEQSYQFGAGDTVVRVYDKVAEIEQQSDKAWFFELWGRQENVWRVEFQVRGERLKQAGIRTLDDLRSFQIDLLRELAKRHTSLRRPNGDRNRSRWPHHPLWKALTEHIATLPQTGLICDIPPQAAVEWKLHQAGKAVHGYLKQIAALGHLREGGNGNLPSLTKAIAMLPNLLKRHHNETLWREDVAQRIKAFELGQ